MDRWQYSLRAYSCSRDCCAGFEFGPSCAHTNASLGKWGLTLVNCSTVSITAIVSAGAGSDLMLSLTVGGQAVVFNERYFSYAQPFITSLSSPGTARPLLLPTTGILASGSAAQVILRGFSFGPPAASFRVTYGALVAYVCLPVAFKRVCLCVQASLVYPTQRLGAHGTLCRRQLYAALSRVSV